MRYLAYAGNLVALAAIIIFLYLSYLDRQIFIQLQFEGTSGRTLLLSILVYIGAIFLGSVVWHILLHAVKEKVTLLSSVSIFFLSQAAKYIPGNISHHIGRVVLARRYGLGLANTLFTMFMETLVIVGVAVIMAFTTLITVGEMIFEDIPHIPSLWVLAILASLVLVAPMLGHRAFEWAVCWWSRHNNIEYRSVHMPSLITFWFTGFLYIVNFLVLGLVVHLIASGIFGTDFGDILLLSGMFAIAWVAGLITPGAPAGLGVREVILIAGLTPIYGNEAAIGITAVLRLVTLLGDGITFLIGIGFSKYSHNQPTTA